MNLVVCADLAVDIRFVDFSQAVKGHPGVTIVASAASNRYLSTTRREAQARDQCTAWMVLDLHSEASYQRNSATAATRARYRDMPRPRTYPL